MHSSNHQKAEDYVTKIEDTVVRRMVGYFLQQVLVTVAKREARPEEDFDLEFYVKVVHNALRHPDLIQRFLDGEDVGRWAWPDDLLDETESAAQQAAEAQ